MDYRDLCIRQRRSLGVSELKTAQNLLKSNFASLAELIAMYASGSFYRWQISSVISDDSLAVILSL